MLGSGFSIHDAGSVTFPPRVRKTGIAESTDEFLSRHVHATSTSSLKREPKSQFGVLHDAGQPAHGDGWNVGRARDSTAWPSKLTAPTSPSAVPAPTDAGGLALGISPSWFTPLSQDQSPIRPPGRRESSAPSARTQ